MNLRQKCKKQKQYIGQLERMALPSRSIFYDSDTLDHLRVKRIMPDMHMFYDEEMVKELTKNRLLKIWRLL